jgi:hypothetical protein
VSPRLISLAKDRERDLLTYAERCGYDLVGVFKETASGAKSNRAERQKVIEATEKVFGLMPHEEKSNKW